MYYDLNVYECRYSLFDLQQLCFYLYLCVVLMKMSLSTMKEMHVDLTSKRILSPFQLN